MSSKRVAWAKRIEAWQESGLSVAAFCRSRGLTYSQFVYWQRVLRSALPLGNQAPSLVPVMVETMSVSTAVLELDLPNGLRLRVPSGFCPGETIALVRGLCAC